MDPSCCLRACRAGVSTLPMGGLPVGLRESASFGSYLGHRSLLSNMIVLKHGLKRENG